MLRLKINVNQRASTIEDMLTRRRQLVASVAENIAKEIRWAESGVTMMQLAVYAMYDGYRAILYRIANRSFKATPRSSPLKILCTTGQVFTQGELKSLLNGRFELKIMEIPFSDKEREELLAKFDT